jgi:hypothetical protein
MAEKITGETFKGEITKKELLSIMKQYGVQFFAGQDYGFGHAFACITGGVYGAYMFIIDAFEIPGLEINEKIAACDDRIKDLSPAIYGDTESPSDIKTFRKHGYKMKDWVKGKGSVKEGIDCVRIKLSPFSGEPQLYLLKDDEGCDLLAKRMSEYHWKMDTAGRVTDIPDDADDDACDALRYLIMNVFPIRKGRVLGAAPENTTLETKQPESWMSKIIQEHTQAAPFEEMADSPSVSTRGRKGRLLWDL